MLKIILLILTLATNLHAYVDLQLGFSFSNRRVEAIDAEGNVDENGGEATSSSRGVNINWAWYLWEYTALELNYAESEEIIEDSRVRASSDGAITFNNVRSTVKTKTQGVGVRQTFAPRSSRLIPSLSVGYARYITSGDTFYKYTSGGIDSETTIESEEEITNSSYATATLAIRVTKLMRVTLSARTVVPGVDFNEADKNITYSGGLSWVF